jgi:hypothetical protein
MAASSEPSDGACIVHHKTDKLLAGQHTVSIGQADSPVKERAKHTQSLSAFLPTWLVCVAQVSCVSKVSPRYRAIATHCIGCPRNWTGVSFWIRLAVLTKSMAVHLETLQKSYNPTARAPVYRDGPPDNRREAMDCWTWLQEPCRPRTALARGGDRVQVYRSHTD